MKDLIDKLRNPEQHYPGNFNTPARANAVLMALCQEAADALATRQWVPLTESDIDQIPYSCSHADSRLLERFASLVAAAAKAEENKACAKVCDDIDAEYEGEEVLATWCAAAIRARGESK